MELNSDCSNYHQWRTAQDTEFWDIIYRPFTGGSWISKKEYTMTEQNELFKKLESKLDEIMKELKMIKNGSPELEKKMQDSLERLNETSDATQPEYTEVDFDSTTGWICPRCGNSNSPQIFVCVCSPALWNDEHDESEETEIPTVDIEWPLPQNPWVLNPPVQPNPSIPFPYPWSPPYPSITFGSTRQTNDES